MTFAKSLTSVLYTLAQGQQTAITSNAYIAILPAFRKVRPMTMLALVMTFENRLIEFNCAPKVLYRDIYWAQLCDDSCHHVIS